MSKVLVRIDLEEIKKTINKLSDSEKESLFFEFSPGLGKALQKMEQKALKNLRERKTIPLEKVENELQDRIWKTGFPADKKASSSNLQKNNEENTDFTRES